MFLRLAVSSFQRFLKPEAVEVEAASGQEKEGHLLHAIDGFQGKFLLLPFFATGKFYDPASGILVLTFLWIPAPEQEMDRIVGQGASSAEDNAGASLFPEIHVAIDQGHIVTDSGDDICLNRVAVAKNCVSLDGF